MHFSGEIVKRNQLLIDRPRRNRYNRIDTVHPLWCMGKQVGIPLTFNSGGNFMYQFPKHLYADIRLEDVFQTSIAYENGALTRNKTSREAGAFLRVWDGQRWYYSATTDLDHIQQELDALAALATPNPAIDQDPVVTRLEVNRDVCLLFKDRDVRLVPNEEKVALLQSYLPVVAEVPEISDWEAVYLDTYTEKWFWSSLGADLHFDHQRASLVLNFTITAGSVPQADRIHTYQSDFPSLAGHQEMMRQKVSKSLDYAKNAVPVVPGTYTCVFSPETAGVFAHESFGHKSEADLMLGSEAMMQEWAIGTQVGSPILNILDSGLPEGSGYVPYDDEGTRTRTTYLIQNGKLTGRLHSAATAALLNEEITGNARAINFSYEPIVRMTATYIGGGDLTLEELLAPIELGVYIHDFNHGSGMSTFTIAPSQAYMIRNGKLAEPVRISVITGNVMHTLHEIDGLTKEVEVCSQSTGGCGKMEQWPLRVAFGGPYVRVRNIQVQ